MKTKRLFLIGFFIVFILSLSATVLFNNAHSTVNAQDNLQNKSYNLYFNSNIAQILSNPQRRSANTKNDFNDIVFNTKLFTWVDNPSDAVIMQKDSTDKVRKVGNSSLNLSTKCDTDYYNNAGVEGITPNGVSTYLIYGYPEIFFCGNNAQNNGFEMKLNNVINTSDYKNFTFVVGWFETDSVTENHQGYQDFVDVYFYGKDKDGSYTQKWAGTYSFYVGSFTYITVDFPANSLSTVERIALNYNFGNTYNLYSNHRCPELYMANFKVGANSGNEDKVVTVKNNDYSISHEQLLPSLLNGSIKLMGRVYNTGGSNVGKGVDNNSYKYYGNRFVVGKYLNFILSEPVNVNDYKYLDIKIFANGQIAEGNYLLEQAKTFNLKVLSQNATELSGGLDLLLSKGVWNDCRIPLKQFADDNGYVSKLIFYYSGNDEYQHDGYSQDRFSADFLFYDGVLSNNEEENLIITYIESPIESEDSFTIRLKASTYFYTGEKISQSFAEGILINNQSLFDLINDNLASVDLIGYYVNIQLDSSLFNFDNKDTIQIKKGSVIRDYVDTSLTVCEDETFCFSADLYRFELVPDFDYVDSIMTGIFIETVETGVLDAEYDLKVDTCNSIWVTFYGPIDLSSFVPSYTYSLEELVQNGCNEMLVYGLAKKGVFASVMDKILVNGKSLRQWLVLDYQDGCYDDFSVKTLGLGFNTGKTLRILSTPNSNLKLGKGVDMTIEFLSGFSTPNNYLILDSISYKINGKDVVSANCIFDAYKKSDVIIDTNNSTSKGGCSGSIKYSLFLPIVSIFIAFLFTKKGAKDKL